MTPPPCSCTQLWILGSHLFFFLRIGNEAGGSVGGGMKRSSSPCSRTQLWILGDHLFFFLHTEDECVGA